MPSPKTPEGYAQNNAYQRKWYKKNKQLQKDRNKIILKSKQDWLEDYKSQHKCKYCDENHNAVLEFHHRNPLTKECEVSRMVDNNASLDRIKTEINKCDILCANCHRKLHYNERHPTVTQSG